MTEVDPIALRSWIALRRALCIAFVAVACKGRDDAAPDLAPIEMRDAKPSSGPTNMAAMTALEQVGSTARDSDAGKSPDPHATEILPEPDSPSVDASMLPRADAGSGRERVPRLDPGNAAWVPVASDRVLEDCRLDPNALRKADEIIGKPWAAIRYGRLCHVYQGDMAPAESFSITKFLGAVVSGAVSYQTRALQRTGPKTGPFRDEDRVDAWFDPSTFGYNPEAHVAHVLGMVAQSEDLAYGKRKMEYDYIGFVQLDSLNFMLSEAIAQPGADLGGDLDAFSRRFVFEPLGISASTWSLGAADKSFGFGWETTVTDMARLGLLLLRAGMWNGQRLLAEEWVYRMTHPSFEDANTSMGYCTWLNARANFNSGTIPTPEAWSDFTAEPRFPGPCAPASIFREHPHGLSESPDCNYGASASCDQALDVGVWQSFAGFGSVIQGHPGLDLLLVGFQITPDDFFAVMASSLLWDAVRPAVIDADPTFAGDEGAFCAAYGSNHYAPDL